MSWQEDVLAARQAAREKHGERSIECLPLWDRAWLPILVEEVGEVANAMTYDSTTSSVRAELVDVIAVASAWVDAYDAAKAAGDLDPF